MELRMVLRMVLRMELRWVWVLKKLGGRVGGRNMIREHSVDFSKNE